MKNILCKIGLHKWHTVKSIRASFIVLLLKKHSEILRKVNIKIENDYIVRDRICLRCHTEDNEIEITKEYYKEKMLNLIKSKNE